MASGCGHNIAIDFKVETVKINNEDSRNQLLETLCKILHPHIGELTKVASVPLPKGDFQIIYSGKDHASLSVKIYANGLVSASYEYFTQHIHKQLMSVDAGIRMESELSEKLGARSCHVLPAIKRGLDINVYFTSSDDRILEYDVDGMVFEEQSQFQKVQIIHTKSYGNVLVLDNMINLGENDLVYTHGLMNKGVDSYDGKNILILGGGDGALLYEILKENPKHVLMIDIDDAVMRGCQKHLRKACGTTLDCYKTDNYEIIVGDAFEYLRKFISDGTKFDYVFGDLTDIPVGDYDGSGDLWEFLGSVMKMASQVLMAGTGRYLTHTIGTSSWEAIETFEKKLKELPFKEVTKYSRTVPSFLEDWVFFQATLDS